MKFLRFIVIFILGGLAGTYITYIGGDNNFIINFTIWRAMKFMDSGLNMLILNNIFVLASVLYGGVAFALL